MSHLNIVVVAGTGGRSFDVKRQKSQGDPPILRHRYPPRAHPRVVVGGGVVGGLEGSGGTRDHSSAFCEFFGKSVLKNYCYLYSIIILFVALKLVCTKNLYY